MERTKTGFSHAIALTADAVTILREHIADLERDEKTAKSDLLFPSITGGFRSRSVLDKTFAIVAAKIKLTKHITPSGMRRTFQDLCRAVGTADLVTRSISGHRTPSMQAHDSTVDASEQRAAMSNVIELVSAKKKRTKRTG